MDSIILCCFCYCWFTIGLAAIGLVLVKVTLLVKLLKVLLVNLKQSKIVVHYY
jgi:hypothetical protein